MDYLLLSVLWFLFAFAAITGMVAGGALALRALLPMHHPGRRRLLAFAKKSPDIAATILNLLLWGALGAFGVLTIVLA